MSNSNLLIRGQSLWTPTNPGNLNQGGQHQHKDTQRDEKQEKPGDSGQIFWYALGTANETFMVVLSKFPDFKCDLLFMVLWLLGLWLSCHLLFA